MPKENLKRKARETQGNIDPLTDELLPDENYMVDTHRATPKADGGIYTDDNTIVTNPISHMIEHGNLRVRSEMLEDLKAKVDDREQVMKFRNKVANQLRAYERRTDSISDITRKKLEQWLADVEKTLGERTKMVKKAIIEMGKDDELVASALGVVGIGEITVAYMTTYLNFDKARHASSFWAYAGLDKASHERYTKGETSGGNKSLRTALWNGATSIEKNRKSPYREVYDRVKERLSISEKMTKSRNTQGKLIECMWQDTKPCHRQGAAKRAVMKHILADYWLVGRKMMGLSVTPLYAEAILGKDGHKTIDPESRGWK